MYKTTFPRKRLYIFSMGLISDTWDWKGTQKLYHWQKWQFNLSALAEISTKAKLPLVKNSNRTCNFSLLPEAEFKVFLKYNLLFAFYFILLYLPCFSISQ